MLYYSAKIRILARWIKKVLKEKIPSSLRKKFPFFLKEKKKAKILKIFFLPPLRTLFFFKV